MKKTAIVSCYFHHNYGSMLQALATQMALNRLEYDNETINISGFRRELRQAKMAYFIRASLTSTIFPSKYGMALNVLRRKFGEYGRLSALRDERFREFSASRFSLSPPYPSLRELGLQCGNAYSAVLVGSDQLWTPANIAADYYTLNFVPPTLNTIAYATSFGQASLPRSMEAKAAAMLKKIRHISVREKSGQAIVEDLTGRRVPIVCDPVLLFTARDWARIQSDGVRPAKPYIFCYFLGKRKAHREFASRLAKTTELPIVALTHLDEYVPGDERYADETSYDVGPTDFLNLIHNASYVCTDSFHVCAFSLLFEKKFFAFRRYPSRTRYSTNDRLDHLLSVVGMRGKILNGDEGAEDGIRSSWDYGSARERLEALRRESWEYLSRALKDTGGTDI